MSIFDYNDIIIPDCSFKISPSSIGRFFSVPCIWYRDNILSEKSFTASTSTVLGTIVHACAESSVTGAECTRAMIDTYIDQMAKAQPLGDDPILKEVIREHYPEMAKVLVNDYIRKNPPTEVERAIWAPVLDNIYIGGTCDNRTGDTIIDYKTYSSTTEPSKISFDYKIQALAYAFAFRYNGIPINRIRLVYVSRPIDTRAISEKTGKPIGKLSPSKVTVLSEMITPEDWTLIEDTLMLIAETIKLSKSNPEYTHLLFKSMKLKGL